MESPGGSAPSGIDIVKGFLRAQNLEQLGRLDEAIPLYEAAVAASFDSTGPYDRLISLYAEQARHRDVVRIADLAITNVRTHEDKRSWYQRMRTDAGRAADAVPPAAPKQSRE